MTAPSTPRPPVVYTVSRLNRETRFLLNDHFDAIWIEGEISNHTPSAAGHHYFTLKDADAQIRCALFKGQARLAGLRPGNGMHVLIKAEVSLYEPRGDYQLIVLQIEAAGDGALMRAYEVLKQRLLAEGLFDASRKRPIPALPHCIGVISSPTGAAIHDVLTVLKRRFPAIAVLIFPARVQGNEAVGEIIQALETADRSGLCDVLILARGGGSLEDLQAFNAEMLARTIARLNTPLVTGIGHEVDYTIADFVADWRAPTPSAAAETVTPDVADWLRRLERLGLHLQMAFKARLSARERHWALLDKRLLTQHPRRQLEIRMQRLDELKIRLAHSLKNRLRHNRERLTSREARLIRHHPRQRLHLLVMKHDHLHHRLISVISKRLETVTQHTAMLAERLHAISPLATLGRGYAYVRKPDTGILVRSLTELEPGELMETRLTDGSIISQVTALRPQPLTPPAPDP